MELAKAYLRRAGCGMHFAITSRHSPFAFVAFGDDVGVGFDKQHVVGMQLEETTGNGRGFGCSDAWGPADECGVTNGVQNKSGYVGSDR